MLSHYAMPKRPRRIMEQYYSLTPTPEDILTPSMLPMMPSEHCCRAWRPVPVSQKDLGSCIKLDEDKFQVNLDVQHFLPEEISVKAADGYIVVKAKHEEKQDDQGYVSRKLVRRYALREGTSADTVESRLSSDGMLTIIAPRKQRGRDVPMMPTGPVRTENNDAIPVDGHICNHHVVN